MFNEKEMSEMAMELDAIGDLANAISNILEEEKTGTSISPVDNVVHVDFSILSEFEKLKDSRLKLPQVLAVYHDWAERTYMLCQKNRGRLQGGRLRQYIDNCILQIGTIERIFPAP